MITEINEEYEIKLQRALYLFNSEFNKENRIEYHGMWDIDEAKWRLNNDNFQFWVVEYKFISPIYSFPNIFSIEPSTRPLLT